MNVRTSTDPRRHACMRCPQGAGYQIAATHANLRRVPFIDPSYYNYSFYPDPIAWLKDQDRDVAGSPSANGPFRDADARHAGSAGSDGTKAKPIRLLPSMSSLAPAWLSASIVGSAAFPFSLQGCSKPYLMESNHGDFILCLFGPLTSPSVCRCCWSREAALRQCCCA